MTEKQLTISSTHKRCIGEKADWKKVEISVSVV